MSLPELCMRCDFMFYRHMPHLIEKNNAHVWNHILLWHDTLSGFEISKNNCLGSVDVVIGDLDSQYWTWGDLPQTKEPVRLYCPFWWPCHNQLALNSCVTQAGSGKWELWPYCPERCCWRFKACLALQGHNQQRQQKLKLCINRVLNISGWGAQSADC